MLGQVVLERTPPGLVAEQRANHVQHPSTLRVQMHIKDVEGLVVGTRDDWSPVAPLVPVKIALGLFVERVAELVFAVGMLSPNRLEVCCKALV